MCQENVPENKVKFLKVTCFFLKTNFYEAPQDFTILLLPTPLTVNMEKGFSDLMGQNNRFGQIQEEFVQWSTKLINYSRESYSLFNNLSLECLFAGSSPC